MLSGTYFKEKESRKKASMALMIAAIPQDLCLKPSDFFNNKFATMSKNADKIIIAIYIYSLTSPILIRMIAMIERAMPSI